MYPKDKVRDPDGNDLNSTPNSNFYTLYSRLGVDIAGPKLGTDVYKRQGDARPRDGHYRTSSGQYGFQR